LLSYRIAEYQGFVISIRDSMTAIQVDLRHLSSYTIVPGSIIVGIVGTSTAISIIAAKAAAYNITLTYQGVTYYLLRRTTTTPVVITEPPGTRVISFSFPSFDCFRIIVIIFQCWHCCRRCCRSAHAHRAHHHYRHRHYSPSQRIQS
jgi:hypothetical protein